MTQQLDPNRDIDFLGGASGIVTSVMSVDVAVTVVGTHVGPCRKLQA